jgi:hypothetical protein
VYQTAENNTHEHGLLFAQKRHFNSVGAIRMVIFWCVWVESKGCLPDETKTSFAATMNFKSFFNIETVENLKK